MQVSLAQGRKAARLNSGVRPYVKKLGAHTSTSNRRTYSYDFGRVAADSYSHSSASVIAGGNWLLHRNQIHSIHRANAPGGMVRVDRGMARAVAFQKINSGSNKPVDQLAGAAIWLGCIHSPFFGWLAVRQFVFRTSWYPTSRVRLLGGSTHWGSGYGLTIRSSRDRFAARLHGDVYHSAVPRSGPA